MLRTTIFILMTFWIIYRKFISQIGYQQRLGDIDVGDRSWRRNVLVNGFWPFLPPINIQKMSPRAKFCHQHRTSVCNFNSLTSEYHQNQCRPKIAYNICHQHRRCYIIGPFLWKISFIRLSQTCWPWMVFIFSIKLEL